VSAVASGCSVSTGTGINEDGGASQGGGAGTGGSGGQSTAGTASGGAAGANGGTDDGSGVPDAGPVVVDPAPDATTAGESRTCDAAGLDSDVETFVYTDVAETTIRLQGAVSGAVGDGVYYVSDGTQAIGGPVATSVGTGAFDVILPLFCGEQLVKLVWTDAGCALAVVTRVVRIECDDEDIRVTLSWDALGDDFELHLIKQNGRINDGETDCTWTSCVGEGPDWGVAGDATDDPIKDVDDVDTYGPENIYYSRPEAGTYTVMVEHWGAGSPEADGSVIINVGGQVHSNAIQNLPSQSVWTVGTIQWPSGTVTLQRDVFNCSASWASGCNAEIP
jgi:hypothetical protein